MKPAAQNDEALFATTVALPADYREQYLDEQCAGDPARRARLDALLAAHHTAATQSRPFEPGEAQVPTVAEDIPGQWIGSYKLLQRVGEGGCGEVFLAEQEQPVRRRVALKIIKLGMATRDVVARFEAERQALALMDHPNIAKVFDAGVTRAGRPYFVMEFIHGVPITQYCDEQRLPGRERLGLLAQVCQAIQHAHHKGIIHRDIKPANVLVAMGDGRPVPKVIDFGIAKATQGRLTDQTFFTALEQFVGTPAYMSPEQAELSGADVDTRSDVYSLGVLLYELLTGRTPFDPKALLQAGIDEVRRHIREVEPARPSACLRTLQEPVLTAAARQRQVAAPKLLTSVRGDLDWITMRSLAKDRARRYATASALATDLERFLRSEPVSARPPGTWYLLRKLASRHRVATFAVVASLAAILEGGAMSVWFAIRAYQLNQENAAAIARSTQRTRDVKEVLRFARREFDAPSQAGQPLAATTPYLQVMQRAAEHIDDLAGNRAEVALALHTSLAWALTNLHDLPGAQKQAERQLALALQQYGEKDYRSLRAMTQLGRILARTDRIDEAAALETRLLRLRKWIPRDDRDEASVLGAVAEELSKEGYKARAGRLFARAYEVRRAVLGAGQEDTSDAALNLADHLGSEDRLLEALAFYRQFHQRVKTTGPRESLFYDSESKALWRLFGCYRDLGERAKQAEVIAELLNRVGGRWRLDLETGRHLQTLGLICYQLGRRAEAEHYCGRSVEIYRRVTGPAYSETKVASLKLALVQGREAEVTAIEQDLLAAARRLREGFSPERPGLKAIPEGEYFNIFRSLKNLADFYEALEMREEFVRVQREICDMAASRYGHADGQALGVKHALGIGLRRLWKLPEAEKLQTAVLAARRSKAGAETDLWEAMHQLAITWLAQGRFEEAEALHRELVDSVEKRHGRELPVSILVSRFLAWTLQSEGRLADAETLLTRLVPVSDETMGPTHTRTLYLKTDLADAYSDQLKLIEAERLQREIFDTRTRLSGPWHDETLAMAQRLALTCARLGKFTEAESLAAGVVEKQRANWGERHRLTLAAKAQLAEVRGLAGDLRREEELLREVVTVRRKASNAKPFPLADNLHDLGANLLKQDRAKDAEEVLRESLVLYEPYQAQAWLAFAARSQLGESLRRQKRLAEAEPMLLAGYEGLKRNEQRIPPARRERIKEAIERLVAFYTAVEQPRKASEWQEKLAEFDRRATPKAAPLAPVSTPKN